MPYFYIEEVTKKLYKIKASDIEDAEESYEKFGYVVAQEVHVTVQDENGLVS
jgi:hypothetical protein